MIRLKRSAILWAMAVVVAVPAHAEHHPHVLRHGGFAFPQAEHVHQHTRRTITFGVRPITRLHQGPSAREPLP